MRYLFFLAGILFNGALLWAVPGSLYNWSAFWSGSWEDSKTLYNQSELRLSMPLSGLFLRTGVLDRRPMDFEPNPWNSVWGNPERHVTNFTAGLYHQSSGSRVLFGVLDEWGLPSRIRNPWSRSPPFPENRKPIIADLRTSASSTREDELYLFLSSPFLSLNSKISARAYASAQTEVEEIKPAVGGGLDLRFSKGVSLTIDTFHTWGELEADSANSWFSPKPPLPEREFRVSAAGFILGTPLVTISSDWAVSQAFAVGEDIYGGVGISISPLLPVGRRKRPLTFSFAADAAGDRFISRNGNSLGAGLRTAGKIEWTGSRNSLFRVNGEMRYGGLWEEYNRWSSGIFYRFPAGNSPVRVSRVSFSVNSNAVDPEKVSHEYKSFVGFSFFGKFGANFSGSVVEKGWVDGLPVATACELTWSPSNYQLKSKIDYSVDAENQKKVDISFTGAARFKNGSFSLKAASSDFMENWGLTVSWRVEKK